MRAIVNVPVCTLYAEATRQSTTVDEALYGMIVDLLEEVEPGWYRVRTHYRYEGIVCADDLLIDEDAVIRWSAMANKMVFHKNFCDVLSMPKVQGWHKIGLPRGAVIRPLGEPENGWQEVELVDGRTGFVQSEILVDLPAKPVSDDETVLRRKLVEAAMLYKGTHYRWGGKSPLGIDCSGLCSMAYLLCGILIYRDANLVEGFPMHEIPLERMKAGDLIFFPGHVAMYLGDGRYCHSTARKGSDGFDINSLNPGDPDYREDLHHKITHVGSYFE